MHVTGYLNTIPLKYGALSIQCERSCCIDRHRSFAANCRVYADQPDSCVLSQCLQQAADIFSAVLLSESCGFKGYDYQRCPQIPQQVIEFDLSPFIRAIVNWNFPPLNGRRRKADEAEAFHRRANH